MTPSAVQDSIAREGARALADATGCRKYAARRLGRSVDVFDKYLAGDRSSPVFRHDMLILAVHRPFALIAHAKAVAMENRLEKEPTSYLVARFNEIMRKAEPEAEAKENMAGQSFYATGDLEALAHAAEEEAGVQEELTAICRILAKRRVDPRTYGRESQ